MLLLRNIHFVFHNAETDDIKYWTWKDNLHSCFRIISHENCIDFNFTCYLTIFSHFACENFQMFYFIILVLILIFITFSSLCHSTYICKGEGWGGGWKGNNKKNKRTIDYNSWINSSLTVTYFSPAPQWSHLTMKAVEKHFCLHTWDENRGKE